MLFRVLLRKKNNDEIKLSPLAGGLSKSKMFSFSSNGKKYVLRILDKDKELIKRQSEVNMHRLAANLGIAPKLLFADKDHSVVVMDFIEGRTFSIDDLKNHETLKKVMKCLKKIHNFSGEILLNQTRKIEQIEKLIARRKNKGTVYPSEFDEMFESLKDDHAEFNRKVAPCHGDFNPGNIMIGKDGNVYFIDFSEAAFDSPFLDIGWLALLSGADSNQTEDILSAYLERSPTKEELDEVFLYKRLTALLTLNSPRSRHHVEMIH